METIYNTIGINYNSTRNADAYITGRLLYFLQCGTDKLYLDIGCGTGNYTIALAEQGLNFTGVDPSEEMLREARRRHQTVNWVAGYAEQIPATAHVFDAVLATLTIHHWPDLFRAFNEINRVTKYGGKLVVFTATPEQMKGYWLNHYFPGILRSSIRQMPSLDLIGEAANNTGFEIIGSEKYFVKPDLADCFLYSGKHRPEIYFNETVRKGISSFAALANEQEVQRGLAELYVDLEAGKFEKIKKSYDNNHGDYLFIEMKKRSVYSY